MSDSDGGRSRPRPRQVTLGGLLALTGCVLTVFSMLDSMARVRSVEMRASVERVLTDPPGSGLGIDVDTVVGLLRGMVLVTGGLAAAGVVLAAYTLGRHRGARIGLSITAVLMLFTATFVSGLLPVVVAIGATMLWSRDAREWFSGRPSRPDPHAPAPSPGAAPPATGPTPGGPTTAAWQPPAAPPATQDPWARPPVQQPVQQPVRQQGSPPPGWPSPAYAAPRERTGRPVQVVVAAWLTWVFSGITLLFLAMLVLLLLADQGQLLETMQANPQVAANGYTSRELLTVLWVTASVGITWCLAAIGLAVLAYRRVNLGRIGLVVSAGMAGVVGLLTIVGALHAMAALASVVLLFWGGVNRWYGGQEPPPQHWGGPGPDRAPDQAPPPSDKPPVW